MHRRQNPTGQSLFLLLSACGGSSTPAPDRGDSFVMGRVFGDRHVAGARVYVDINNNHQFDEGIDHYIGETDQTGAYQGTIPSEHRGKPLLADLTDARDLSAPDVKLSGIWRAPEGSTVISPMTELLVALDKNSEEILNLLSLDTDIDLTIYDPFSDGEPDPTDQQVIEIDPNLVLKLIKDKHQLEEKITDLSDIVSVFDKVITIEVPENHERKIALHTFAPPDGKTGGTFALTDSYIDNHLFTIDEDTGELTVFDFQNRGRYLRSFHHKVPFDENRDNIYNIEAIYIAPDDSRHATQIQIEVKDVRDNDTWGGAGPDKIAPSHYPEGEIPYLIKGWAYVMPLTGPVQITWGLDLREGHHALKNEDEIKYATALVEKATAEFEAAANIDYIKSESTNPEEWDIRIEMHTDEQNRSEFTGGDDILIRQLLYGYIDSDGSTKSNILAILVHEIGHSLGLSHPFGRGWLSAPDSQAWGDKTVMSYKGDRTKTENILGDLDKAALVYLYGPPNPKSTWADFDGLEKHVGLAMNNIDKKIFLDHKTDDLSQPFLDMDTVDIFTLRRDTDRYEVTDYRIGEKGRFDNDLFTFDSITNAVSFKEKPDHKNPKDSFGSEKTAYNGVYEFTVQAYLDYNDRWETSHGPGEWYRFELAVEII